jgi:CRP/FNR family transcriptional regulator, cyclic AMP receptor protein
MKVAPRAPTPAALQDVADHPFLREFSPTHLEALASCAMRLHYEPGDLIFREGDPANRFYLIIKGKVVLEVQRDEKHVTLQTISDGSVLGWSWLFPPFYVHFDARAIEPTEALFIYATRLREMCELDHELGYKIHKRISSVVVERLIAAENQLVARNGQPSPTKGAYANALET